MEEGDQTDIILLDFAKTFDKVPHDMLLHKMEFYGVRQNSLEWIKQFLTNRTQSVILENHKSDPLDVVSGVPQELGFARSFDSESMLLITKDLVAIEVVHDGTMDNVLQ
jgi:hypothetical protein